MADEAEWSDKDQSEYEAHLGQVDALEDEIGDACDDKPILVVIDALVRHLALALHGLDAEDRIDAKYDIFRSIDVELQAMIVGACDA